MTRPAIVCRTIRAVLAPRRPLVVAVLLLAAGSRGSAQFSPGPLSAAHRDLEGPTNCTKCHDVGKEIAGSKCLDCHVEIRATIDRRTGYHAAQTASRACVACHKEHLGVDAKTYLFDPAAFDHDLTGFGLTGKHGKLACARCHAGKNIRDPRILEAATKAGRTTYLGLGTRCADCHSDVHRGSFGPECANCHNPGGWRDVRSFDHSRTKFTLLGKHAAVGCEKCHKSSGAAEGNRFAPIAAATYADCAPCHSSPHRPGAVAGNCAACHDPGGWELALKKPFDHARTRYPLAGAHTRVGCTDCHRAGEGTGFAARFQRPFARCIDCHSDRHEGAFAGTYNNDCARCHSVTAYSPSNFTLPMHQESPWVLSGSHRAVLCADCHRRGPSPARWVFRMRSTACEECHADPHKGQFASEMRQGGCASCHTADGWRKTAFAHGSLTSFPLEGRHATVPCESCHKEIAAGPVGSRKYAKLAKECGRCHADEHRGQFAAGGTTDCSLCHGASAWRPSRFDHDAGSAFKLSGAHARVACAECHRKESIAGGTITRYKPLPSACESCHQGKEPK